MSLKLANVIKNTQEQILSGIAEAHAAGVHVLPPMTVSIEVGLAHSDQGFRVADFNDVVIARVHLEVGVFADVAAYETALLEAMEALRPKDEDPFAGPATAGGKPEGAKKK